MAYASKKFDQSTFLYEILFKDCSLFFIKV